MTVLQGFCISWNCPQGVNHIIKRHWVLSDTTLDVSGLLTITDYIKDGCDDYITPDNEVQGRGCSYS